MIRQLLADKITSALTALMSDGRLPRVELPAIEITDTKNPEHGDYACNVAMTSSKLFGKNPREIGDLLAAVLREDNQLQAVDVAGPGFLNITVKQEFIASLVPLHLSGINRPIPNSDAKRINVEHVSVNPNGPITIGSGRGAAFGSTLCNVLEAAGHTVHREYYVNDGVNSEQMRLFAESVKAICTGQPLPENGYKGDYVHAVAAQIDPQQGDGSTQWYQGRSQDLMIAKQESDLRAFGLEFDTWFYEQTLHNSGTVARDLDHLVQKGVADEKPYRTKLKLAKGGVIEEVLKEDQPLDEDDVAGEKPTLWLRSTKFGDDQDRVLRRRDGRPTYISSDLSYHVDKYNRPENADKLITVVGPDHHGYIARLTAVIAAHFMQTPRAHEMSGGTTNEGLAELGPIDAELYGSPAEKAAADLALATAKERLQVAMFQIVRFMKDGKPAPMRKRDGNIYALIDLINEIGQAAKPEGSVEDQQTLGRDVARFFYLMRSHETAMDFDLDLATKQSDENPVFYVQYAHARISSILSKAAEQGLVATTLQGLEDQLVDPREKALMKKILDLPHEIQRSAEDYGVHRLATYATELARVFHYFYDGCRVIQPENKPLSEARLALCDATKRTLKRTFDLLGISAPEQM